MVRILVTDGMDKSAVEKLRNANYEVVEKFYEPDELGAALKDFDIIVIRSATKIRKPIIDKAAEGGRLKLIIRAGVGVDNIDVAYALEKGIKVSNTPKASSASVAELTIAHMFTVARFLEQSNVTMREGKWEKKKYKGIELSGKTLGLIGFGRIAREVAVRAKALGMKVIYYDVHGKDCTDYEYRDFEDLLKESDFVSLHCPYDAERGAVITEKELALMKDGSYLVNCARGGVVAEDALLAALESGKLAGACIDVYEKEPTPNMELVNHPRVSVSPHIGASTKEAQTRIGEEVVDLIMAASF
ncbi:MAG: D-2-hydroxyacid dehydrogenase [Syntrophomonadaceae bacterium]|nr:D-2-hydroxyacid dehydrogenase [Syntrophomonadaceae bacterium]MDD3889975.1 D-2-hydroxyacid dehydrogenase [Syntrophomonadaceae bacterium]MDD4550233.1 D-2-hydroxyacid dehydrogenase [Syntrophomonadaceae bacterium]